MPTVKFVEQMFKKYSAKYSGENVTAALNAVKPIMEDNFQAGHTPIYDAVERVRGLLSTLGIPSTLWGTYIAFAEKIVKKTFNFSDRTLEIEVSALKQEFVTAHGADASVLDAIIQLLLGAVPPY